MIKLKLKKRIDESYQIIIGSKLESRLKEFLESNFKASQICIICDSETSKLFGNKLAKKLKKAKVISFKKGEKNKNLRTVEEICEKMVEEKFNRKDLIIALGGGVTGDIAGFVAAIYMRGIPFIQMPTSLLAMVDSSVGGKTGVDLSSGKNLVGTFNQPKAVFIDLNHLKTLPKKEFNSGMAEIIKHGIIQDKSYFKWIEKNKEKIKALDKDTLKKLIEKSCLIKKRVVQKDEKEGGLRRILNYGHTIGHALEQLSNYRLRHGEAISIGMVKENSLSRLKDKEKQRIIDLFEFFSLPIDHKLCREKKDLLKIMKNDKKRIGKLPSFAIPKRIGKTEIKVFTEKEVLAALD